MIAAEQLISDITNRSGAAKPKIALDTNCVEYYLGNQQPWADCLDPVFQAGLNGQVELYVSMVVVSELLAHAHFDARNVAGYDPELRLLAILNRHFQILDVTEDVARAAGRLRGNYIPGNRVALKTPDALIGATSLTHGHTLFITNDAQLADALPPSNRVYLRDWALEWLGASFPSSCLSSTTPVKAGTRGEGLGNAELGTFELGAVRPNRTARWNCILRDAFRAAAAFNEPCLFFVLTSMNGTREETSEVVFWHTSLAESRPVPRVIKHLQNHLGYSTRTKVASNPTNRIYAFCFTSMRREHMRQSQPGFASKSMHQRSSDAWNQYLLPIWEFRHVLTLPQVSLLICEDGVARELEATTTLAFLNTAAEVMGWKQ